MAVITEGRGTGSGMALMTEYNQLLDLTLKLWNYHFEFLNLGYAAYLDFFGFCKGLWPTIPDQAIAKMVAGIQVDLFQPDEELKKLARLAVELGVDVRIESGTAAEVLAGLESDDAGRQWLAAWEDGPAAVVQLLAPAAASTTPTRCGWSTSTSRWASSATTSPRCAAARALEPSDGGGLGRARPDRGRVLRADRQRRGPGDLRGQAGAGPHGVPVRREPQLLRRALGPLGDLAQDARARRDPGRRGFLGRTPTTSSCCRATRCRRRCSTSTHGWAVGIDRARAAVLAREIARRRTAS